MIADDFVVEHEKPRRDERQDRTAPTPIRKVIMVAFRWPPQNCAGVQRALKFAQYLPDAGWLPTIVTAAWRSGDGSEPYGEITFGGDVHRVEATDERWARRLALVASPIMRCFRKDPDDLAEAIRWRTRRWLQFPDRRTACNRWIPALVRHTLRLARGGGYDAVCVTAPPQSMMLVAWLLARLGRLPLVLDLRDPWTQNFTYREKGLAHRAALRIEGAAVRAASRVVVVSPRQAEMLRRLHGAPAEKIACITNGYDLPDIPPPQQNGDGRCVVCLMGESYEDPRPIFGAIRRNARSNPAFAEAFCFRWMGCSRDVHDQCRDLIESGNVQLHTRLAHRSALELAAESQALWLEVALTRKARYHICGKTFEYLALRKPIVGTAPQHGATRKLLAGLGLDNDQLISQRDEEALAGLLGRVFNDWRRGHLNWTANEEAVGAFRRDVLAGKLAQVLENAVADKSA